MLAVRHHCYNQLDLLGIKLGPGVEHITLHKWDVSYNLIRVDLYIGYYHKHESFGS